MTDACASAVHYDQLLPLASRLDETYLAALGKLEAQIQDAAKINQRVGSILGTEDVQVVPLYDGAYSPREIYFAFADALASKVMPILAAGQRRQAPRIHDLVDWSDAPARGDLSNRDYLLAKIRHAQGKTMAQFLEQLVIRYNPETLPELAGFRAVEDLIATFSVVTAMGITIPVRRGQSPVVVRHVMPRVDDEPMWQVLPRHHAGIARAANALATLALLKDEPKLAASIGDMLTAMDVRLEQTLMRYEPGTSFHASAFLKVSLQRDGADFHFGQSIFDIMEAHLRARVADIHLVFH